MSKCQFAEKDEIYMRIALQEACKAARGDDVPVGAVLVENATGAILAAGHNTREAMQSAIGHAEINVIDEACTVRDNWRLSDCTLYVTLEPCPMCAGAIIQARIPRIVCGSTDPIAGAMGSVWALHRHPVESKHIHIEIGCLERECREILQTFFQSKRERKYDTDI